MAYTAQSVSGVADFFTKLETFLAGEGWNTYIDTSLGRFAAWKNPSGSTWITLATQWNTTSLSACGIYQWHGLAYNSGSNPWAQNDDSGNGAASTTNATLAGQRHVLLNGGGTCDYFWCFEDSEYFHVVLRTGTTGAYRYMHFGAGNLVKYNDFTGGEYCYAQAVETLSTGFQVPRLTSASYLLDGLAVSGTLTNMQLRCATIHLEGLPDQGGSSKWGVVLGNQASGSLGTDRAAVARVHVNGGFRGGLFAPLLGNFSGTYSRGLVPLYPIVVAYWNRTTDNVHGPLGYMPDVRGVHLLNFEAEDVVTMGGDTWVVFPSHRRVESVTSNQGTTGYQGIAYRRVT